MLKKLFLSTGFVSDLFKTLAIIIACKCFSFQRQAYHILGGCHV